MGGKSVINHIRRYIKWLKEEKISRSAKLVDRNKQYSLTEAVDLLKQVNYAKFDATVEIAFRLNIDPRKAEQNLRGAVSLPYGTGKNVRVLVIANGDKAKSIRSWR